MFDMGNVVMVLLLNFNAGTLADIHPGYSLPEKGSCSSLLPVLVFISTRVNPLTGQQRLMNGDNYRDGDLKLVLAQINHRNLCIITSQ